MTTRARARSFDSAAALYGAHRPGYPPALFDAVETLAGRSLAGARVADVGAGTGIASALLRERGAEVVAVEPGDGMAAEFRRANPGIPLVRGDGDRLPLATGAFDLLTYAQAWHWTDPARSVPEARRVLRPGGALAIWWNDTDSAVPWVAEQEERLRVFFGSPQGQGQGQGQGQAQAQGQGQQQGHAQSFRTLPRGLGEFTTRSLRWSRRVTLDDHLANLASHSAFLVLGEARTRAYLAAERELLAPLFPDGTVEEQYVVTLGVALV
ncbi:class I SAM-dependent methyltransferase [Streptomyces sp. NBC_01408]|uniref:class I SAM-dependent methyltransferase n=1 Tax=Streptomyces sp. NBC_01408 TaxID=2903855 RepID=UPI002252BBAB|nr:class I SAM-dependent methyltransferase [Streptomyces sp. NBC_01408]MCX4693898.1 class I SAM-dependent methyltransferase [Streptomyces sp. NBC_01408]